MISDFRASSSGGPRAIDFRLVKVNANSELLVWSNETVQTSKAHFQVDG
jgi:hypothetical protein